MSDRRKQMVIRWFQEVWNQGCRESIDEMLPADCVIHDGDSLAKGPEAFKPFYDKMRNDFSRIHIRCHEAVAEEDYVCVRWSLTMHHKATDRDVETTGVTMVRFAGNRFAEAWQNWDMRVCSNN